jgi:hypothetical protein
MYVIQHLPIQRVLAGKLYRIFFQKNRDLSNMVDRTDDDIAARAALSHGPTMKTPSHTILIFSLSRNHSKSIFPFPPPDP